MSLSLLFSHISFIIITLMFLSLIGSLRLSVFSVRNFAFLYLDLSHHFWPLSLIIISSQTSSHLFGTLPRFYCPEHSIAFIALHLNFLLPFSPTIRTRCVCFALWAAFWILLCAVYLTRDTFVPITCRLYYRLLPAHLIFAFCNMTYKTLNLPLLPTLTFCYFTGSAHHTTCRFYFMGYRTFPHHRFCGKLTILLHFPLALWDATFTLPTHRRFIAAGATPYL